MGEKTDSGFTIIEVMLFLAVTALLMFALMGGWTVSMNTQSYRDSLRSTAQFLESQFTGTTNVTNMRDNTTGCDASASTANVNTAATPRGQTDCVIIGKYLAVTKNKITAYTILGTDTPADTRANPNDVQVLQSYHPTIASGSTVPSDEFTVPWQAKLYTKNPDGSKLDASKGIAIIRSPKNGFVRAYYGSDITLTTPSASDLNPWLDTASTSQIKLCFDPDAVIAGDNQMITLAENAATSQSVAVAPECTT